MLFLILLMLFPSVCVENAKSGLLLWFNTIIPTLFPFILVTNILRNLGGIPWLERLFAPVISRIFKTGPGGSYPVVLGFLCGYPMGAKAITDSLACRRITTSEAYYLLSFTNNPSPIYMISYVALFTLQAPEMKLPVIIIAVLTAVLTAFFYRHLKYKKSAVAIQNPSGRPTPETWPELAAAAKELTGRPKRETRPRLATADVNTREAVSDNPAQGFFDRCIVSAFELLVKVGGYMILFSILSGCLLLIPGLPPIAACLISGLLEQTTGLGLLKTQSFSLEIKTVLAMVFICFGGLSISAQTQSVIHAQGLSVKPYIFSKLLSGIIAAALTAAWFWLRGTSGIL